MEVPPFPVYLTRPLAGEQVGTGAGNNFAFAQKPCFAVVITAENHGVATQGVFAIKAE